MPAVRPLYLQFSVSISSLSLSFPRFSHQGKGSLVCRGSFRIRSKHAFKLERGGGMVSNFYQLLSRRCLYCWSFIFLHSHRCIASRRFWCQVFIDFFLIAKNTTYNTLLTTILLQCGNLQYCYMILFTITRYYTLYIILSQKLITLASDFLWCKIWFLVLLGRITIVLRDRALPMKFWTIETIGLCLYQAMETRALFSISW